MTPGTPAFQPVACGVIERNDGQLVRSRLSENVPMIYEPAAVHHWKVASDTIHDAVLIPGTLAAYEQLVQDASRLRWIEGLNVRFEVSRTKLENDLTPHYSVTMDRGKQDDQVWIPSSVATYTTDGAHFHGAAVYGPNGQRVGQMSCTVANCPSCQNGHMYSVGPITIYPRPLITEAEAIAALVRLGYRDLATVVTIDGAVVQRRCLVASKDGEK